MALFKYTSLEFIQSCIENGIYASRLNNINDPFEGKGVRYPDQYRVVCMTASPFQMIMWAYYGNHRGCCIEFDVDVIKDIRPVDYIKEFQDHEDMNTQEVIASFYRKGNEWKHEKEYRFVYYEPTANKILWKTDGEKVYLIAPVKKIVLGYAAEMEENYQKVLEYLRDYNASHEKKIEVTKCRLMNNRYQLEADKQFDISAELLSIRKSKDKDRTFY